MKKQNNIPLSDKIKQRIIELSEFDGLGEVMLQKAELNQVLGLIEEAVRQIIEELEIGKLKYSRIMISVDEVKKIIKNRFGFEDEDEKTK